MNLSEDENKQKYVKKCERCIRNTLLPNKYAFTCNLCAYNVIKRTNKLTEIQRNWINFINRLKYSKHKIFCICIEVYNIYGGNDYNKIGKALSTIKSKKTKFKRNLNRKIKSYVRTTQFGQDYYSRTATGYHIFGHDGFRLMRWLRFYHRAYYVNITFYDLVGSILKNLIETSWWPILRRSEGSSI